MMELCHKNPTLQSPTLEKLGQFVLEWQTRWEKDPPDFERFEHELHERIMALECELLTAELARYDVDVEQLEVGGGHLPPNTDGVGNVFVGGRSAQGRAASVSSAWARQ
jgi:hypothetical protein